MSEFSLDDLINCYRNGIFPMADNRDDDSLFLVDPPLRGVLPLNALHIPKRLMRTVRQDQYQVKIDTAFNEIIEMCAMSAENRPSTWISRPIQSLYQALFARGLAHSVEVWEGDVLTGGLYGVAIGGAFFGESMVSRAKDVSKIALIHLAARLKIGHFELLDCQFLTDHLKQFGTVEIDRADYRDILQHAIMARGDFYLLPPCVSGKEAIDLLK